MKRKTTGFTLIEMLVTITVAAILLSIGIPSFLAMLATNRLATATNEFTTSMSIARSDAIKRRTNVVITATDGSNAGNEWGPGWSVTVSGGGPTLKVVDAFPGTITLDSAAGATSFTYSGDGMVNTPQNLYLCDAPGDPKRWIEVTTTGRVSIWSGNNAKTVNNPNNYACP